MFDTTFLESYGLLALFLICFLSATILPLSSELVVFFFLNSSKFSTTEIIFIASIGNILGGISNYFIGYFFASRFSLNKENKAYRIANSYGFVAAFISWIPFIGDPILIALGFLRVSFWKVVVFMSIGKMLRYMFIGYLN